MPEAIIRPFEEKMVSSALLEIPRNTDQRSLNPERVKRISHSFDERIANEPKVSLRDGHYVVFDGQHVIAARVDKNSGEELPMLGGTPKPVWLAKSDASSLSVRSEYTLHRIGSSSPLFLSTLAAITCWPSNTT